MIKNKGSASSAGLMEDAIRGNGKMGNKMGRVHTGIRKEFRKMEHGSTERKLSGTIDNFDINIMNFSFFQTTP